MYKLVAFGEKSISLKAQLHIKALSVVPFLFYAVSWSGKPGAFWLWLFIWKKGMRAKGSTWPYFVFILLRRHSSETSAQPFHTKSVLHRRLGCCCCRCWISCFVERGSERVASFKQLSGLLFFEEKQVYSAKPINDIAQCFFIIRAPLKK